MRTWARVITVTMCGRCGRELAAGDPVLRIDMNRRGGKTLRFQRCDQCEGPAPPDLPAFIERTNAITPTPLARMRPVLPLGTPLAEFRKTVVGQCVDTIVTDYRSRQSGEREPGEEG